MAKKKLSRDQKRKQKKQKQARPQRQPADPAQRMLNRLQKSGFGTRKVVRNPPGEIKMSEVLREFVDPYWHIADTEEAMGRLLTTALVAWNTALQPEEEQANSVKQVATALPEEAREDFYSVVAELIERKNKYFAQYDRMILDYELVDRGDDYHITVVSWMPSPDTGEKQEQD